MAGSNASKNMALGGVLAALAVVIMCLGGLIPLATYACPMLCCLLLKFVYQSCGKRIGWSWYGAVSILSLLMGPDKEAAAVFVFFGYYPLVKPKLDGMKLGWLIKALLFNASALIMYYLLIHLFGMAQLASEFQEMGNILMLVTLALANVTFFLLDKLLGMKLRRRRRNG